MTNPAYSNEFFNIAQLRDTIRGHALSHTVSQQTVLANKQRNLSNTLAEISSEQHAWWFGNHTVNTIHELESCDAVPASRVQELQDTAPHGIFGTGELMMTSSGSTGRRKVVSCDLEHWFRYFTGCSRQLFAAGIDHTDRVLTTDPGMMQSGYRALEDAAKYGTGAQIVIDRTTSMTRKLEMIAEHDVTVLIANPVKLMRMAKLQPHRYLKRPLKAIISTGMPLEDPEIIKSAFKTDKLYDVFGSVEISQIYFTCQHGHRHVNDDLLHVVNKQGKSLYSNVWSLPVFNLDSGDYLEYSYKGQCDCGSYLPTVDVFVSKSYLGINKQ